MKYVIIKEKVKELDIFTNKIIETTWYIIKPKNKIVRFIWFIFGEYHIHLDFEKAVKEREYLELKNKIIERTEVQQ